MIFFLLLIRMMLLDFNATLIQPMLIIKTIILRLLDVVGPQCSTIFFISFLIMIKLIFLNIFIAIILIGYDESREKEDLLFTFDDMALSSNLFGPISIQKEKVSLLEQLYLILYIIWQKSLDLTDFQEVFYCLKSFLKLI